MTPEALREALEGWERRDLPALPGRRNDRPGAVMVPVAWEPEPEVIVTLRPTAMRRHGGEISFPGGRPEEGDADLWATARREAAEELAIHEARLLGRLSSMPLYTSDFRLFPFVADVSGAALVPEPAEVAAVFRLPVAAYLGLEAVEGIPFDWRGEQHMSPLLPVGGHTMYGATAHTFWELLQVCARATGVPLPPVVESDRAWTDVLRSGA